MMTVSENSSAAIYLIATLDTKGVEAAFVRDFLISQGCAVAVVDAGCQGEPAITADVSREEIFALAGASLYEVRKRGDRGEAVTLVAEGVANLVRERHAQGKLAGVMGLGGSAGTTIGAAAMRELPFGVPKVMVSTHASGNVRGYVGNKDIVMVNPIVDIAGLNRISRNVLRNAAGAMLGMVRHAGQDSSHENRPIVAATMFGVTTPCVAHSQRILEQAGYEVLVFHATGSGGEAMESLIDEGLIAGVLDITTTEIADELCEGFLSAGPARLTAAGRVGIPQVVSVGATDMVNFHGMATVPEKFRGRKLYKHNEHVTLMRTTPEENCRIGEEIARKAAEAQGPTVLMFPKRGVSAIDREGQPFDDPEARQALLEGLRIDCGGHAQLQELDYHINDAPFAEAAANRLLALMAIAAGR